LFDDGAETTRAMASFANPPMDKPIRKIKNGSRVENFRTAEQTRRAKTHEDTNDVQAHHARF
jgi:hypothetical protein